MDCAACWCPSRPRVTQFASQYAGAIPLRAHRSCGRCRARAFRRAGARAEPAGFTEARAACRHHHAKAFGLETTRIAAGEPWHGRPLRALARERPCHIIGFGLTPARWRLHAGAVVDDYFEVFDFGSGCVCCRWRPWVP
jgi:hypothetical protein